MTARRADAISDQAIKDMRTVTVTGELLGTIPTRDAVTLWVRVPKDAVIEIQSRPERSTP